MKRVREEPKVTAGFDQVRALRVGYAVCTVAVVALVASSFIGSRQLDPRSGRITSAAERRLSTELQALRATWDPKQRERILSEAAQHAKEYFTPLRKILLDRGHALLGPAVDYAGALGDDRLRPLLLELARGKASLQPKLRAAAVTAADALGSFSVDILREFLSTDSPSPVKLAALKLCVDRTTVPGREILALMSPEPDSPSEPALVEAALRAFPRRPDRFLMQDIWNLVSSGDPEQVQRGLRALLRTDHDVKTAKRLLSETQSFGANSIDLVLELLTKWGKPLPKPGSAWALIEREDLPMATRARAFFCLERTQSFDPVVVKDSIPTLPVGLRYYAARCMIVSETKGAQDVLFDLLEQDEDKDAASMSRQLLAWMTGKGATSARETFEDHLATLTSTGRFRKLPDLPGLRSPGASKKSVGRRASPR